MRFFGLRFYNLRLGFSAGVGLVNLLSLSQNSGVGLNDKAIPLVLFKTLPVCVPFVLHMVCSKKLFKKKKHTLSSSWQKVKTSIAGKVFKSILSVAICMSNNRTFLVTREDYFHSLSWKYFWTISVTLFLELIYLLLLQNRAF